MKKRGWLLDRVYKRVKGDRGGSVSREGHHDIDSLVAEGFAAERTTVRSTNRRPVNRGTLEGSIITQPGSCASGKVESFRESPQDRGERESVDEVLAL